MRTSIPLFASGSWRLSGRVSITHFDATFSITPPLSHVLRFTGAIRRMKKEDTRQSRPSANNDSHEIRYSFLVRKARAIKGRVPSHEIMKKLAHGSLWALTSAAVSRMLVLVGNVALARTLGQSQFGEYGLLLSTISVFSLIAAAGLGTAATQFIARYSVSDRVRAGRITALIIACSVMIAGTVSTALVLFANEISSVVVNSPRLASALYAGAVVLVLGCLRAVQGGILAGLERFDVVGPLNVIESIISLPCMLLGASMYGLSGVLWATTVGPLVCLIGGTGVVLRTLSQDGIHLSWQFDYAELRPLARYCVPNLLNSSLATPINWICMLLVARTGNGTADIALYNAAYQWVGPLSFLPGVLTSVAMPMLIKEWEGREHGRFISTFMFLALCIIGLALVPSLVVAGGGRSIMRLYGIEYVPGAPMLALLAISVPAYSLGVLASNVLFAMEKQWIDVAVSCCWGFAVVALVYGGRDRFGVAILALSFCAGHFFRGLTAAIAVLKGARTRAA
jgi:O-antigen/teichoic acid export membrane protein